MRLRFLVIGCSCALMVDRASRHRLWTGGGCGEAKTWFIARSHVPAGSSAFGVHRLAFAIRETQFQVLAPIGVMVEIRGPITSRRIHSREPVPRRSGLERLMPANWPGTSVHELAWLPRLC